MTQPCSSCDGEMRPFTPGRVFLKCLMVLVVVAVMAAVFGSYLRVSDWDYWVETQLLFFDSHAALEGDMAAKRALEKELEILMSPAVVFLTAQDVFTNDVLRQYRGAPQIEARLVSATDARDQGAFLKWAKWLAEARTVRSSVSGGVMTVRIGLNGPEQEVLRPILDAYVDNYIENRRRLAQVRTEKTEIHRGPTRDVDLKLVEEMGRQLHRIDWKIRRCELALQRMDSGRGVFCGFMPETEDPGIPGIQRFQQRIVDLEIEKAKLGVQFKPGGREIRSLNYQIAAVKKAMKECLTEHLQIFLKGRAELQAKIRLHQQVQQSSDRVEKPVPHEKCMGKLPGGDAWFLVDDGLYMVRDKSFFQNKPLLARFQEYQAALFASFQGPPWTPAGTAQPAALPEASPAGCIPSLVCTETDGEQR